jgi:hypothetical protein
MAIDRESWERLQNDVEMIKTRVSSLDRITVMRNSDIIIEDIKKLVRNSPVRAVVLHLTKEEISRQDLAKSIKIDSTNVNKFLNPFFDQDRQYECQ